MPIKRLISKSEKNMKNVKLKNNKPAPTVRPFLDLCQKTKPRIFFPKRFLKRTENKNHK